MMLNPRTTPGASVTPTENGWRLEIPAGPAGTYRLAQLDNYRSRFPLSAPATLSLRCRVSDFHLPGTWGFGFWNDPFTVSLGLQGTARRLPVLPNAAWFFHASEENHISLQNHLPGNGFLAQCFSSPKIPSLLLAPALLALPFMFSKRLATWIRAIAGKIIREDAKRLEPDVTQWHEYRLKWSPGRVEFSLDGAPLFETETSPRGPLGLVVWIDNQFAAFTPNGKIQAGTQENPVPAWMEIANLEMRSGTTQLKAPAG
ncbi:MAG: hypothetical protein WA821_11185 [Anaerolineales bacterium]